MEFHKAFLGVVPLDLPDPVAHPVLLQSLFSLDLCGPEPPLCFALSDQFRFSLRGHPLVMWSLSFSDPLYLLQRWCWLSTPRLMSPETLFTLPFLSSSMSSGPQGSCFPSEIALGTHWNLHSDPSTNSIVLRSLLIVDINKLCLYSSLSQFCLFTYYILY